MTSESTNRQRTTSVATLFIVNGLVFSNWLPRIPEIRDRLGVDNAGLGASLVGGGLGGLVGSLVVARVLRRLSSKQLLTAAALALAIGLPLIAFAPSAPALFVVLTLLGFCDVLNDLAMNSQGVMIQRRGGRPIMQRLHAGWSLGFTAGSGIGLLAAAAEIGVRIHFTSMAALLACAVLFARRHLLDHDDAAEPAREGAARRRFSPMVVMMSVLAIGVAFIEIIPSDWSAVTLRDVFDSGRSSGLATVVFASSMLLGRAVGDHAVAAFGGQRLLTGALALVAIGVVVVVTAPGAVVALFGFALWGLGTSVMAPQIYEMAATLPGTSQGAGLGAMAVGQRLGFLAAAAGVGALAEAWTLRLALLTVALVGLGATVATKRALSRAVVREPVVSSR